MTETNTSAFATLSRSGLRRVRAPLHVRLAARARRIGLVTRFTVIAGLVGICLTWTLATIIGGQLSAQIEVELAARAEDQARLVGVTSLQPGSLELPHDESEMGALAERIEQELAQVITPGSGVIRLNLVDRHGCVIYSDRTTLIGVVLDEAERDDLFRAVSGGIITRVSDLSSAQAADLRAAHESAIVAFAPVRVDGEVVAAYQLYRDREPVERMQRLVWITLSLGSSAGFAVIMLLVRGAARQANAQQRERERLIRLNARAQQISLRRNEERLGALLANSADVVSVLSADGHVTYQGGAADRFWPPADEAELRVTDLVHPEDASALRALLAQVAESPDAEITSELRMRHLDGSWHDVELVARNRFFDENIRGIVATWRDITPRKAFERELQRLAFHDTLTGLPNRALFADRLESALARSRRSGRALAVLFLDLDNFKLINDSLGHDAGDQLLATIASRLQHAARANDTVARFAGDEFTILLEDLEDDRAVVTVSDRIISSLRTPITMHGHEIQPTASMGVAVSSPSLNTADALLRSADLALYRAKSNGKACYALYDESMNEGAVERLQLEADLRHALERDELMLHFQPIVSLATGCIEEVEALIRWQHPERGLVPPGMFIPVAEETGLIVSIGDWVLREACGQAATWCARTGRKRAIRVSVNVAARQIKEPGFATSVASAVAEAKLDPALLKIEITESTLIADTEANISLLASLKTLGVKLAIDDFGTGYSSLAYLKRFPLDTLKIDRSFVSGLGTQSADRSIVESVVTLGKGLGLQITAEGVETAAQWRALKLLGCDQGQGFYFERPIPAEDILRRLSVGVTAAESAA
ncbi:MAG: EAL domain-containing protein [Chloroflexota bacterium]